MYLALHLSSHIAPEGKVPRVRRRVARLGVVLATFFLATITVAPVARVHGQAETRSEFESDIQRPRAPLEVRLSMIAMGDAIWDWTQARTAYARSPSESVDSMSLTTMSRTKKTGTHAYYDIFATTSHDRGQTWTPPVSVPSLRRQKRADGYEVVPGDLYPVWHSTAQKFLVTGKTFNFAEGHREDILAEQVAYAVFDPVLSKWSQLRALQLPKQDHQHKPIIAANAGCHQLHVKANGEVLLPVRYQQSPDKRVYTTTVVRCRFDGRSLEYLEHGSEHSIPTGRGLYEPSIIHHRGTYFLTMRADKGAFVTSSQDGLQFGSAIPWLFDDGESLGSYNTQAHWLSLGEALYLVYTRRGADNDHIMRHRAPLFAAQVDPRTKRVLRATEQVVVPENHATLGNSGVVHISESEAWITVAEGRVSHGQRKGERNRVWLARLTVPN